MNIEKQIQKIISGTAQVTPLEELEKKLKSGKKLKVKLGADPTAPNLHLGHAIVLKKLKQFQDLGHEVIFIIGDFTARIGDPTGKSKTRPALSIKEIQSNTASYFEQVGKILDTSRLTVTYNSSWFSSMNLDDFIKLTSRVTIAQILDREDFKQRLTDKTPIAMHETFYPVLQGYDSVMLQADVELGGTDQTFNLFFGRHLQEQFNQESQVIITMPILEGISGTQKMSKSLGNEIGLAESPDQAFGKLMSLSDKRMWHYMHLLLETTQHEISIFQERVASGTTHPMALKKQMAHDIVALFWSKEEAQRAEKQFEEIFQKKDYSHAQEFSLPGNTPNPIWIVELLNILGVTQNSSQAKRLIEGKAIMIDDQIIAEFKAVISWKPGTIIKAGKHTIFKLI